MNCETKPLYMVGHAGLAGRSLFAATEEHITEAYLARLLPRTVSFQDLLDWKLLNKSEEWNDEAQS